MEAMVSNEHQGTNSASDRSRRKRKKKSPPSLSPQIDREGHKRWRSEKQQRIYSTKLVQALRKLRISQSSSNPPTPRRGRAVREAADKALAVAARGRTLWSRAILTSKSVKLKYRKQKRPRFAPSPATASMITGNSRSRKPRLSVLRLKGKSSNTAVDRKVKELSRLVPGCRKQPLPVMLEETTDYIAALQMQIRAMTALTELLTGGSSSSQPPPPPRE